MDSASHVLAAARAAAGLSVRALAQRASVAPSTVSRIEQGSLDPTLSTLARLLECCGYRLRSEPSGTTPDASAPRLADLARAWQGPAISGSPDWTALRATVDLLTRHPELVDAAVRDAPRRPRSPVQRALLAGLAERLAAAAGLPAPAWALRTRPLAQEWSPPGTPQMRERWREATLPELRARRVVVDERTLFRSGAPARRSGGRG